MEGHSTSKIFLYDLLHTHTHTHTEGFLKTYSLWEECRSPHSSPTPVQFHLRHTVNSQEPALHSLSHFYISHPLFNPQGLASLCCCAKSLQFVSDSVRPHRWQPTRLPRPWDSPGKNTGVGCHFLLHCMEVNSESEVAQSCPTLSDPMDCSPPGSSVLKWSNSSYDVISHFQFNFYSFYNTLPLRVFFLTP